MDFDTPALVRTFVNTPFATAATAIDVALTSGASVHMPDTTLPSSEIRGIYAVRQKSMRAAGITMPGFDDVVRLLEHDENFWLVGIEGEAAGGVIFVSESGRAVACFSYVDDT